MLPSDSFRAKSTMELLLSSCFNPTSNGDNDDEENPFEYWDKLETDITKIPIVGINLDN
jgi:hypothetical protein